MKEKEEEGQVMDNGIRKKKKGKESKHRKRQTGGDAGQKAQ